MISARLTISSNSPHTCGVLTGFHMLNQQHRLNLTLSDQRTSGSPLMDESLIEADINGLHVVFDLMDGYFYNHPDSVFSLFESADYIFKRSYSRIKNSQFPKSIQSKIRPFGLNYFVTYPGCPITPPPRNPLKRFRKWKSDTNCYVSDFESSYSAKRLSSPRILFLTRLWSPSDPGIQNHPDLIPQWEAVSNMRIELLRQLRKRFSSQLIGGVFRDSYAEQCCPDLIAPPEMTCKRNFLKEIRQSDICIASTGLHESIGWKTAEYVAAGRAIVSEKLCYEVPGDFLAGQNYLEFATVHECLSQIEYLLTHQDEILVMAQRNHDYYQHWLRPDSQILQALEQLPLSGREVSL